MSLISVASKNILANFETETLRKCFKYQAGIQCVSSKQHGDNGPRSEMQQLLKLLDKNHYVSRYTVCDDKVIVPDIFWTHPKSIKLFNTFPNVLIIDSMYKTNKYKLPLLEIVGVTSMENIFQWDLHFLNIKNS
ncbi:uncharacterized protein LOC131658357 [Vicia villosa]|uniref:uncharacterized protein LOC131658357 n=1 Tax=Vicia villosa TaxID=3911 RepID=UPI00273B2870|nr:uncharacterized protein LOC131658357 [Vicia villosa]